MPHPSPIVTVDIVLLTLEDQLLKVALHSRSAQPFVDVLALPGGYVHADEDTETLGTAYRVLKQKAGFSPKYLEQLSVFSGPSRDPRGWSLSVAYMALIPVEELKTARDGIFLFYPVDVLPALAFDHAVIIAAAVDRLRSKSSYSTLPFALLPELFTLGELQATYEAILGAPENKANFRRKIDKLGVVEPSDVEQTGSHRPARLYRATHPMALFNRTLAKA